MNGCKLNSVALGLALGILWGVSVLIVGIVATFYSVGHHFAVNLGYTPSVIGSLLTALIAFIDAFIMGYLVGWLYNKFSDCTCRCCDKEKKEK